MEKINWKKITATTIFIQQSAGNKTFPFPIYQFLKSQDDVILMSYEEASKISGFNKSDIITRGTKSEEGSTLVRGNKFFILYNGDTRELTPQRIRYTLAHELGHIMLGHFNDDTSMLSRKGFSELEYKHLEAEANAFASELLSPNELIPPEWDKDRISLIFDISDESSKIVAKRISKNRWLYKNGAYFQNPSQFGFLQSSFHLNKLPKLPKGFVIDYIEYAYCQNCRSITPMYRHHPMKFCPVCGRRQTKVVISSKYFVFHETEERNVIDYKSVELDDSGHAKECPECHNTMVGNKPFCEICGTYLINRCSGYTQDELNRSFPEYTPSGNDFTTNENLVSCPDGQVLSGRARFCPFCGCLSTFALQHILPDYKEEMDNIIEKKKITPFPDNTQSNDVSDELPF